jgi:hypothetical protein
MKLFFLKRRKTELLLLSAMLMAVTAGAQEKEEACIPEKIRFSQTSTTIKETTKSEKTTSEKFTDRQATVKVGSSVFELWQDRDENCASDAEITVKSNKTFSAKWSNVFNALAREAVRPGSSNTKITYKYTERKLLGNSFWGGYGWWREATGDKTIVEYYVVEDYNNKTNATFGMDFIRSYTANNRAYELWLDKRTGPTVYADKDLEFIQIKAVRAKPNRASGKSGAPLVSMGTIDMGTHFTEWAKEGKDYTLGDLFEVSLKVEGYGGDNEFTEVDCTMDATFSKGTSFSGKQIGNKTVNLDVTAKAIRVFPNPANASFTISTKGVSSGIVTITDLKGRKVYQDSIAEENLKITTAQANLGSGIYFIEVASNDDFKELLVSKLIIQ